MTWRQTVPTTFTLAAMLSGFLSILMTVQGMVAVAKDLAGDNDGEYFRWAAALIMMAMILDGLDGNLARWLKGESEFGAELDTYVDMTAFGIAPAILVFAVTLTSKDTVWRVLLPSAVALSGVVRLARFKVKDPLRGQGGYSGLPITVNAAWVALFVFVTLTPPKDHLMGPTAWLFLVGIVIFISLQVSTVRYPKPTKNVLLFGVCALLVAGFWVLHLYNSNLAARLAMVMIALGLGYVVVGPWFVKGIEAHKARKEARENGNGASQDSD